ncbi:redoxin domain-containing protein, partial [Jatrophihabitans endophyticus]|uniref:redoxin domain-containing protein n=1 Tax=Jatrophihabitans endophyticus TaxID=1206085 RepID=UPI0019E1ED5C
MILRRGDPPGTLVTVRASDETGRPLDAFTVTAAYQPVGTVGDVYNRLEPLGRGGDGRCTVLVPLGKTNRQTFRLKVEAAGRQTFTSEPIPGEEGDRELAAVLPASGSDGGEHPQIVLRLPDGQPAAGASVVLHDVSVGERGYLDLSFFGDCRPRADGGSKKTGAADGAGGVALPAGAPDATVVVLHEQGYLFTTLGRLRQRAETTLDPWGRLEGTYTLNGQPKAGQRLMLMPRRRNGVPDLSYEIDRYTDREGHFVFERVPADDYQFTGTQASNGTWPVSHPTEVAVRAGQTTRFAYVVAGRTVMGGFRVQPADAVVDWKKDLGDCLLVRRVSDREEASAPRPAFEDYVRWEDYRRADEAFLGSPRHVGGVEDSYAPEIDENGNFRFEGVPPGNYELRLQLVRQQKLNNRWQQDRLGELKRAVFVAPAPREFPDTAVALGDLEVAVNAALLSRRETVRFTARGLDGSSVDLAAYRGRPVLLLFWASWAPPTKAVLEDWRSVGGRLATVGVTLDDDPAAAERFARDHELPGTQARLEDRAKTAVT